MRQASLDSGRMVPAICYLIAAIPYPNSQPFN